MCISFIVFISRLSDSTFSIFSDQNQGFFVQLLIKQSVLKCALLAQMPHKVCKVKLKSSHYCSAVKSRKLKYSSKAQVPELCSLVSKCTFSGFSQKAKVLRGLLMNELGINIRRSIAEVVSALFRGRQWGLILPLNCLNWGSSYSNAFSEHMV